MVNKQRGFSLVELMVGLGVGTLVSLALVDTTKMLANTKKGQTAQNNAAVIASMISQNLRFQSTCANTFKNGANNIPYDRNQALSATGMPIAMTITGIRAGAAANTNQVAGSDNTVSTGTAPAFNGATSDLRVYGLQMNRLAFIQLAESGAQKFGYVYADFQVPNTSTIFGGNMVRRKILGGVVLDAPGAAVTNCYGNSPQSDLGTICTNMGCTWTAGAGTCSCSQPEFTCGPGELFWGVSPQTGLPICKEVGGGACPPGQYISGVGLERVICSAVPDEPIILPATDCAGGTLSWTVSGNTCTGNVALTTNGSSVTATDSTTPTTGSANFTCNAGTWSAATGATCTAPPAVEPVACYMYSRTFWHDPSDCDTTARYMRGTLSECRAMQESPTACNLNPDCGEITPGSPLYGNCPAAPTTPTSNVVCYQQEVRCNRNGVFETTSAGPFPPSDPTCGGRTTGATPGSGCSWLGPCRATTTADTPAMINNCLPYRP